jgi:hypothetical protein
VRKSLALTFVAAAFAMAAAPQAASAAIPVKPLCTVVGLVSGLAGKACGAVRHPGRLISAGKQLLGGHIGGALRTALGLAGSQPARALGLAAIVASVVGSADFALHETIKIVGRTTSPQLATTWFSSTYWRMTGIAAILTLPFLFAAAVQAMMRADLALLLRAALGYLPLAVVAVSLAAPLTMLLLAATDALCAVVSSAAGNASAHFLTHAGAIVGVLTALSGSTFVAFILGLFTISAAIALWVELLIRAAAVDVIVLLLPLAFAAFVWPARRVWAVRAVELLVALILSKFAIVAVLSLGAAALTAGVGHDGIAGAMTGLVLLVMAAFAPWALLRLIPLAELASTAGGSIRGEASRLTAAVNRADGRADTVDNWIASKDWAASTTAEMRRDAEDAEASGPPEDPGPAAATATGPAAAAANGSAPGVYADQPAGEERIPGADPMWQAEDRTWRPLRLGLDDGWPPPDPVPPGQSPQEQEHASSEDDPTPPGPEGER